MVQVRITSRAEFFISISSPNVDFEMWIYFEGLHTNKFCEKKILIAERFSTKNGEIALDSISIEGGEEFVEGRVSELAPAVEVPCLGIVTIRAVMRLWAPLNPKRNTNPFSICGIISFYFSVAHKASPPLIKKIEVSGIKSSIVILSR